MAPDIVMAAKVDVPLDATLPVKLPATLPVTLPARLPVTLPLSAPVNPELALTVVNAPVDGVVPPMGVPLIVPPVITTLEPRIALLVTVKFVKVPAAAVVAPMGVLLIVDAVMAKACKAAEAIKAVPAELTMATLYPLAAKVGKRSKPRVMFSSSVRIVADEPGELGVG